MSVASNSSVPVSTADYLLSRCRYSYNRYWELLPNRKDIFCYSTMRTVPYSNGWSGKRRKATETSLPDPITYPSFRQNQLKPCNNGQPAKYSAWISFRTNGRNRRIYPPNVLFVSYRRSLRFLFHYSEGRKPHWSSPIRRLLPRKKSSILLLRQRSGWYIY